MVDVVDQTRREEFVTILKYGRAMNEVQEVSTDLGHVAQDQHLASSRVRVGHTVSILMMSWPDRCNSICSETSVGSLVKRNDDTDMMVV